MDTLKTAVVVVLLLAVVYGVYVVLNNPNAPLPQEIAWHDQKSEEPLQIDMGAAAGGAATEAPVDRLADKPGILPAMPAMADTTDRAVSGKTSNAFIRAELTPEPPTDQPPTDLGSADASVPDGSATSPLPPNSLAESNGSWPPGDAAPGARDQLPGARDQLPGATAAAPSLLTASAPPAASPPGSAIPNGSPVDAASALAAPKGLDQGIPKPEGLPSLPSLRQPSQPPPGSPVDPLGTAGPGGATPGAPGSVAGAGSATFPPGVGVGTPPAGSDAFNAGPTGTASPLNAADAFPLPSLADIKNDVKKTGQNALLNMAQQSGALDAIRAAGSASVNTKTLFDAAIREAQSLIGADQWYQALFVLSKFYQSPDLAPEQQSQLMDLLDPLAAKVIYSTDHLVEQPHEVARGETLAGIAEKYQVPWELLANVNGIEKPDILVPGTKLKVLRGPFRAEVDLKSSQLTLFAGELYAGRFPISTGNDPAPKAGEYRVHEKQPGRVYYAGDGRTIPIDDPANPFGSVWIGLGNDVSIHGSPARGESSRLGCISLSPRDAADVYSILSPGSAILIRR